MWQPRFFVRVARQPHVANEQAYTSELQVNTLMKMYCCVDHDVLKKHGILSAGASVAASFSQNIALQYMTFAKLGCGRLFAVMLWGILVNQKSYNGRDYGIAAMYTAGSASFAMTGVPLTPPLHLTMPCCSAVHDD